MTQNYERLGVSAEKPEVHAAIADQDPGAFPGAFCMVIQDPWSKDPEDCVVMHADGAGTKSNVAYLHLKETGDASVFRGIAQDSIVMNTDDILCVGSTGPFAVSSTINRNAHRFGADALRHLIEGHADFADQMRPYDISITLTGGETADIGDIVGTVLVDSTVETRIRRDKVIDNAKIAPGNVIVGFASDGQAIYEDSPNSGIASNGFTFARHALLEREYATRYPETYSSTLTPEQVYAGPYRLDDQLPGSTQTVGEALLSPTRTYLPIAAQIFPEYHDAITGVVHSSGGGQVKCQKFGSGLHVVKDNLFAPPPIFSAIEAASGADRREMYRTFNMGQLLEIYCQPEVAGGIIAASHQFGVEAQVIGRVKSSRATNRVTIVDGVNTYKY